MLLLRIWKPSNNVISGRLPEYLNSAFQAKRPKRSQRAKPFFRGLAHHRVFSLQETNLPTLIMIIQCYIYSVCWKVIFSFFIFVQRKGWTNKVYKWRTRYFSKDLFQEILLCIVSFLSYLLNYFLIYCLSSSCNFRSELSLGLCESAPTT